MSPALTSLLGLKRWGSREKAERTKPLEPVLIALHKCNSSFAAHPAEDNRGCVVSRKEAPGPGHQSCLFIRSLAASSSSNSAFILLPSVNSQTSQHGLFHTRAFPKWILQAPNIFLREPGWTSVSSIHTQDVNKTSQLHPPKLTESTGTFEASVMVPGLVLESFLEEPLPVCSTLFLAVLLPQTPHKTELKEVK